MAEVFTPSWVCNAQNNLVDEAWFGRKDVFNVEDTANHTWKANTDKIEYPKGKTWKDYVRATRMEMTCGEAPYLVSRYDATTGESIPLQERIGLLDRKLRVISENVVRDIARFYRILSGQVSEGATSQIYQLHCLYHFLEHFPNGWLKRCHSKQL